jgi:hypothetical protein
MSACAPSWIRSGMATAFCPCRMPVRWRPAHGDITFTPRPGNTVEFNDRDMNYKSVLFRCRN